MIFSSIYTSVWKYVTIVESQLEDEIRPTPLPIRRE